MKSSRVKSLPPAIGPQNFNQEEKGSKSAEENSGNKKNTNLMKRNLQSSLRIGTGSGELIKRNEKKASRCNVISCQEVSASETKSSFRPQMPASNYVKKGNTFPLESSSKPEFKVYKERIQELKNKILKGGSVTSDEIAVVRKGLKQKKDYLKKLLGSTAKRYPIYCKAGMVSIPTPNNPPPAFNTFGTPEELTIWKAQEEDHPRRRRFVFDMIGYLDQEIEMFIQNKRLHIFAQKKEKGRFHQVEEVIDIPPDLSIDNLRIVRAPMGTMIIEEAWVFS